MSTLEDGTYTTFGDTLLKQPLPHVGGVVGKQVIVFNAEHPRKQDSPIDVTTLGMFIAFSLGQLSKTRLPSFMFGASVICSSFVQYVNDIARLATFVKRTSSLNFVILAFNLKIVPMVLRYPCTSHRPRYSVVEYLGIHRCRRVDRLVAENVLNG